MRDRDIAHGRREWREHHGADEAADEELGGGTGELGGVEQALRPVREEVAGERRDTGRVKKEIG